MKRSANPVLEVVRAAMEAHDLRDRYNERPWSQRNDYLGWIDRAKRDDAKLRRLNQMLDELKSGDVYVKMAWRPRSLNGYPLSELHHR